MSEITEQHIRDAARRVEALPDTEPRVLQIRALVLGTAMDWLADNTASTNHILGFPFTEHGLQLGVEASLRGPGPGRADAGAPLRAGRPGQQRAADEHVLEPRNVAARLCLDSARLIHHRPWSQARRIS